MADENELKKAKSINPVAQEYCDVDKTVVRFVTHEDGDGSTGSGGAGGNRAGSSGTGSAGKGSAGTGSAGTGSAGTGSGDETSGEPLVSPTVHAILPIDSQKTLVGTKIADSIKIKAMIGTGGMSSVYRGQHESIGREVAVKVMHRHLLSDDSAMLRFKQEAQAVGRLDHINIVKVHDFKAGSDGNSFIIMDLVEGVSLADVITQDGTLSTYRAVNVFMQACDGLQHAHSKGIIHRDLKPSNIMLVESDNGNETVKVLDFGIAKILPQQGDDRMKLTQTGEVFGSPLYMSPEQCMGKPVDHRSDIYSMGCLIFEALTGKPPLEGANAFDTFFKHTTEMPPSVKMWRRDFDPARDFDAIILKAMAKDPKDRYQSMTQLKYDLSRLVQAPQRSWFDKVSDDVEFAKRRFGAQGKRTVRSIVAQVAIVLALAGTAGGAWYYYSNLQTNSNADWDQLYVSGQDRLDRGDYAGATKQLEQALQKAGLDNAKVLPVLRELADVQIAQGKLEKNTHEIKLAEIEAKRDKSIAGQLDTLIAQLQEAAKSNDKDKQAKIDEIAGEMCDRINLLQNPGIETHKKVNNALDQIIASYEKSGSADKSILYARALHARAGAMYFDQDFKGALEEFKKSAGVKQKLASQNPGLLTSYLTTTGWVGQVQERLGLLDDAEKTFKERVAVARDVPIENRSSMVANNPKLALAKFRLAEFYEYSKHDAALATKFLNDSIEIYENLEKHEPEEQANCYALLGSIQFRTGKLAEAQENFQRAHDLFQPLHKKKSLFWLETLAGLGDCKFAQKDYAGAEPYYRRALAVSTHYVNQYMPTLNKCLDRLEEIAEKRGAPVDEIFRLGALRVDMDKAKRGPNSTAVVSDYVRLFETARRHGDTKQAQEFLDQATAVCEKASGKSSWEWVDILFKRGQFAFDQGRTDDGEVAFEDAVEKMEMLAEAGGSKAVPSERMRFLKQFEFQAKMRIKDDPDLLKRLQTLAGK